MTFSQKLIDVSFSLANGSYGPAGNTADLSGHRVEARILKSGAAEMGQAEVAIYGLPLELMNRLTTLGTQTNFFDKNTITVKAGDKPGKLAVVFQGTINIAFADARAMPDVCLRVSAHAGLLGAVQPTDPISVKGPADVAQVAGQISQKMGLRLENNNVNVKVRNPYLWGNPRTMMRELAEMAKINWLIDNDVCAIYPKGQTRSGSVPLISRDTILVGYPAYNSAGLSLTTYFDPNIKPGGMVEVQSDLKPACGKWSVFNLEYELDSMTPGGKWFNKFDARNLSGV